MSNWKHAMQFCQCGRQYALFEDVPDGCTTTVNSPISRPGALEPKLVYARR